MKFNIIYADPPWSYRAYKGKSKFSTAERFYNTMTNEDIYNLDVASLANEDCILFLWVTFPNLATGLETIRRWGFTYKTLGFCWVKRNIKALSWFWGLGFWTRSNPEICLIATKGKPVRVSKSVHSVVDTVIEKHSKKPDIVRDKIVELCGNIPKVELFARETQKDWICLGNEIDGLDIRDSIKNIKGMI